MTDVILWGGGGLALELASYIASDRHTDMRITDIVDQGTPRIDDLTQVLGYRPTIHSDETTVPVSHKKQMLITVGDPLARRKLAIITKQAGFTLGTYIHSTAWVATGAVLGAGTIVAPFVFVGPKAVVGQNVLLNVHASIGHDVCLGAHSVISPQAALNGTSLYGEGVFIGAGGIVSPGKSLGPYTKLAAGSVVTRDFGVGFLLHGNPASGRQMFAPPQD